MDTVLEMKPTSVPLLEGQSGDKHVFFHSEALGVTYYTITAPLTPWRKLKAERRYPAHPGVQQTQMPIMT